MTDEPDPGDPLAAHEARCRCCGVLAYRDRLKKGLCDDCVAIRKPSKMPRTDRRRV